MSCRQRRALATCLVIGALLIIVDGQAQAATLVVTMTGDTLPSNPSGSCFSGVDCSLREAVTDANDNGVRPGPDTIQLAPGTYTLPNDALPEIPGDVTIEGTGGAKVTTITGATTIGASPRRRSPARPPSGRR